MKPSKHTKKLDEAACDNNGSPGSNRSVTSYQASLPTQTVQKGGIFDLEANVSRTNNSTHHKHSKHQYRLDKAAISLETGRDRERKGFSDYLEAADEHLARGSVELAFLGYSQAFEILCEKQSKDSLEYIRRFMLKCNELFLFAKNQIDVGSHLRAEILLINLLQFNRRGNEGLQHPLFQVRVLNLLASCQRYLSKISHAQETLDTALMVCQNYGCPAAETYLTLGALQMDLKQYEIAKKSCQESIKLLEPEILETPNKPEARFLATAYYNMGHCCMELGDRGHGVNMYAKALSILKRTFVSTSNSLFVMVQTSHQEALEQVRRSSLHKAPLTHQDQRPVSDQLNLSMDNQKETYKPLFAIKPHRQNPRSRLGTSFKPEPSQPIQPPSSPFTDQGQHQATSSNTQSLRRMGSGILIGKKTRPQSSQVAKNAKTQHTLREVCRGGESNPTLGFVSPNSSQIHLTLRGEILPSANHGKSALLVPKKTGDFILQHRRNRTAGGIVFGEKVGSIQNIGNGGNSSLGVSNFHADGGLHRGGVESFIQKQPLKIKVKLDTIRTQGIEEANPGSSKATLRSKERHPTAPQGDISDDESIHMVDADPLEEEGHKIEQKPSLSFLKVIKQQLIDQPLAKLKKEEISSEIKNAYAKKIQVAWRRYYFSDKRKKNKVKHRSSAARWVMNKFFKIESDLHKSPRKVFPCKVMVYLDRKSTLLDVYIIRRNGARKSHEASPNPNLRRRRSTAFSSSEATGEFLLPTLKWIGWVDVDLAENFFGNLARLRINQKGKPYFSIIPEQITEIPKAPKSDSRIETQQDERELTSEVQEVAAPPKIKPEIPQMAPEPTVSLKIPLILPRKKKPQTPGSSRKNSTKKSQPILPPPQVDTTVTMVSLAPFQILPRGAPLQNTPEQLTSPREPQESPPSPSKLPAAPQSSPSQASFPPIPQNEDQNECNSSDIRSTEVNPKAGEIGTENPIEIVQNHESGSKEGLEAANLVQIESGLGEEKLITEKLDTEKGLETQDSRKAVIEFKEDPAYSLESRLALQIEESVLQKVQKLLEEKYRILEHPATMHQNPSLPETERSRPEVTQQISVKMAESQAQPEPLQITPPQAESVTTKPNQVGNALFGLFKSKIPTPGAPPQELTFAPAKPSNQLSEPLLSERKRNVEHEAIQEVKLDLHQVESPQITSRTVQEDQEGVVLPSNSKSKSLEIGYPSMVSASEKLSFPGVPILAVGRSQESVEAAQLEPPKDETGSPASVRTRSVISAFETHKKVVNSMTIEVAAEHIKRFCYQAFERRKNLLPYRILREVRSCEQGLYMIVIYRQDTVLSIRVVQLKKKGFYDYLYIKINDHLSKKLLDPDFLQNGIQVVKGKIRIYDREKDGMNDRDTRWFLESQAKIHGGEDKDVSDREDSSVSQVSGEEIDESSHQIKLMELEGRQSSQTLPKSYFSQLPQVPQQMVVDDDPPLPMMTLTRSKSLARDFMPVIDYADLMQDIYMPAQKMKSGGKDSQQSSNGSKTSTTRQDVLKLKQEHHDFSFTTSQRRISSPSVFHAPVSKYTALLRDTKKLGLSENLRFRFACSDSNTSFWIIIKELSKGGIFIVELENQDQKYIESMVFETELVGLPLDEISQRTPKERAEWLVWKIAPVLRFIPGTGKPVVMLGDDLTKTSHADTLCISGKYF